MTSWKLNKYEEDVVSIIFSDTNECPPKNTQYELRLLNSIDIPPLIKIRCMKPVAELNGDIDPPRSDEIKKYLESLISSRKSHYATFPLVLIKKECNFEKIIGFVNIKLGFRHEDRQISYYIDPGRLIDTGMAQEPLRYVNWGRGLGTQAVKIASEFIMLFHTHASCLSEFKENITSKTYSNFSGVLSAICAKRNYPSQRILKKIGMKLCAHKEVEKLAFRNELDGMFYFELSWDKFSSLIFPH